MQAVIMAGGKGTRIASVANDIPKPMIKVLGKPVLEYQIRNLRRQGITDITLIIGHLGQVIRDYFKDGRQFGVTIDYIEEVMPLGTAGGLWYLKEKIQDDFLLLNGDIIFDVDFTRLGKYHKRHQGEATIVTHSNNHPYDSGIIITDEKNVVRKWLHKEDERTFYKNRVNAGIHMLSPEIFQYFQDEAVKMDLDRDILRKLIQHGKLVAYDSPEYIRDMGTPERYAMVIEDVKSGLVEAKNLKQKQKAVFLDRDGTINVYKGFIRKAEELELLEGAAQAIQMINSRGYLAIVVTNQPVIARGECSYEELERIHDKMETLLGQEGAYVDDIFYCPHHPDCGFEGEIPELKFRCECRKPKPGLLFEAANKYHIDLTKSYMIGDDEKDLEAGKAAGCKASILINEDENLLCAVKKIFEQQDG